MTRRTTKLRAGLTALAALCVLALAVPAAFARDGFITSFDGTRIVYSFFVADGLKAGDRAPTIILAPGYGSSRANDKDATVFALRKAGYNVLTYDPRGFGDSGGLVEVDSPDFEGRDAQRLIDLISAQPEARLDAPRDPRLGMAGGSYGGGIQNVLAAIDDRVDAITPNIAWNSLITSLDKHETAKGGWGAVLYGVGETTSTALGIAGGLTGEPAGFQLGDQDPHITQAFANGAATGRFSESDKAWFAARGPKQLLDRIKVPTLITQGTVDTLFTLREGIANYRAIRANGVPVKMLWFCGGHGVCTTEQGADPNIVRTETIRWLDRYIKRDRSVRTGPGFEWIDQDGARRGARRFPVRRGAPVKATGTGTLPLIPGDTSGALILATPATNAVNVALPAVKAPTELVGSPTLTMTYKGTASSADARIYAQLVDTDSGKVLGNQVLPVGVVLDGKEHTLRVAMEAIAIHATPQSSYRLQITDGSNVYFPQRDAGSISLSKIAVSVPTVADGASRGTARP